MNKNIIALLIGVLLVGASLYIVTLEEEADPGETVETEESEESEDVERDDEEETEEEPETGVEGSNGMETLVGCLEEENVVIYGSKTCPACGMLADSFGGYDMIEPIYIECSENWDECSKNKETGLVPEIQIGGELHEGSRNPEALADAVGCKV